MAFDEGQIKTLIKNNSQVPKWVKDAREYHKDMKALVLGEEYKNKILRIEHIETTKKANARNKYSRPIKDLNTRLLRLVDNVYTATGGTKVYNIKNDDTKKKFLETITHIRGNRSIEAWLQTFWSKDIYNVDPNGIILMAWKDEETWPTYKSIDNIRNYECDGQKLKWILFEPIKVKDSTNQERTFWRFIDPEKDYYIEQIGQDLVLVTEEIVIGDYTINTYDNPFGEVPGLIASDIQRLGSKQRLAPLDAVKEHQEEYMRDRSILTIYKFLNGFSTPYKPKIICPECKGAKKIGITEGGIQKFKACSTCDGKGVMLDKDVTDEIIIPIDLESDNPIQLPTNFAGFISPDLEIWNQYIKEQKRMEIEEHDTMWGTHKEEGGSETATGRFIDTQPVENRLDQWSNVAEFMEWQITEWVAKLMMPLNEDRVSIIQYGRNYIIQPPEFLLQEYQKSKEQNDGAVILDRKLKEYITSKYKNDPQTLGEELIKMRIEPYVHYDVETVSSIFSQAEAQKKILFTDWWFDAATNQDINKGIDKLQEDFNKWYQDKISKLNIN